MSDIRLIKIITGEELLGEVVIESDSELTIKNILAVMVNPSREGISYGFIPWGSLSKADRTLSKSHVICSALPNDDVLESYNSMFGNIISPPKQLIT